MQLIFQVAGWDQVVFVFQPTYADHEFSIGMIHKNCARSPLCEWVAGKCLYTFLTQFKRNIDILSPTSKNCHQLQVTNITISPTSLTVIHCDRGSLWKLSAVGDRIKLNETDLNKLNMLIPLHSYHLIPLISFRLKKLNMHYWHWHIFVWYLPNA